MELAKGADCVLIFLFLALFLSQDVCLCHILRKNLGLLEEEVEPESGLQFDTQSEDRYACRSRVCLCLPEFQCLSNALRFLKG